MGASLDSLDGGRLPAPPLAAPGAPAAASRPRTGPALLALYFLAPLIGEVIGSYNTPPLAFLNPTTLIFLPALYGSAAILLRELVVRRGLGWRSWILLGAAFGAINEGVIAVTWFDPKVPAYLGRYGHALGVNWVWAVGLTVFHITYSVTIPILLAESAFPSIASRPWLRRRGMNGFGIWLTFTALLGFITGTYELGRLVALGWAVTLIVVALLLPRARAPAAGAVGPAPLAAAPVGVRRDDRLLPRALPRARVCPLPAGRRGGDDRLFLASGGAAARLVWPGRLGPRADAGGRLGRARAGHRALTDPPGHRAAAGRAGLPGASDPAGAARGETSARRQRPNRGRMKGHLSGNAPTARVNSARQRGRLITVCVSRATWKMMTSLKVRPSTW